MENLMYPIGRFSAPENVTAASRAEWIDAITTLPARLEAALEVASPDRLDTPYRPGGWTVRQVVHHIADSHMNAHIRLRFSLTEEAPTIKPYDEAKWALLPDNKLDIAPSLEIIRGIHVRWAELLRSMSEADFQRTYVHPQYGRTFTMDTMTALYVWHGDHHLAHIKLVV